jgi:hypothetical protein
MGYKHTSLAKDKKLAKSKKIISGGSVFFGE